MQTKETDFMRGESEFSILEEVRRFVMKNRRRPLSPARSRTLWADSKA